MNNKKCILVFTMVILLFASPVFAQAAQNKVAINPVGFIAGIISGEYERMVNNSSSLALEGMYWEPNLGGDYQLTATGIGISYRYYPGGQGLNGIYLAPSLIASWASGSYRSETAKVSMYSTAFSVGYQWTTKANVTIDLGAGFARPFYAQVTEGNADSEDVSSTLTTSLKIGIGYAW